MVLSFLNQRRILEIFEDSAQKPKNLGKIQVVSKPEQM